MKRLALDDAPEVLSPVEVAQVLGCGERQAREWIKSGAIYSFRMGRSIRVPKRALVTLLAGSSAGSGGAADKQR